jgi:hypothetical protein
MLEARIQPTLCEYNLFLRCMRDCTFEKKNNSKSYVGKNNFMKPKQISDIFEKQNADNQASQDIRIEIADNSTNASKTILELKPNEVHVIDQMDIVGKSIGNQIRELEWWQKIDQNLNTSELTKPLRIHDVEIGDKLISLLVDKHINLSQLQLKNETPFDRLDMIGNIGGLFKSIKKHKVVPDSKTFAILLQVPLTIISYRILAVLLFLFISSKCVLNDTESEINLIKYMESYKTPIDIFFCNILLKRRIIRRDNELIEV